MKETVATYRCDRCGVDEVSTRTDSYGDPDRPKGWEHIYNTYSTQGGDLCRSCVKSYKRWWKRRPPEITWTWREETHDE